MVKTEKFCDECGENLIIDSQYPSHYTLELTVRDTGINTSNIQYAIMQFPPFEGTKHFCNKKCLSNWLAIEKD